MNADTHMLASGIYTIPHAASLLGISHGKVRSWATAGGQPLWTPTLPDHGPHSAITFVELMDLAATVKLKAHLRTSTGKVRAFRESLGNSPYPLIDRRTNLEAEKHGWPLRTFLGRLDYGEGEHLPRAWWPLGRDVPVLLNSQHAFGHAVTAERCIPTVALAVTVGAEASFETTADSYGVSVDAVMAAVTFELRLRNGNGFLDLPIFIHP